MDNWLPVIATLSGAIVAGAISLLVHWLSNRHSMQHTKLVLAEERARWAIEKRLENLLHFNGTMESLMDATVQFRVQQAWEATAKQEPEVSIPDWVWSYDKARGGFEEQFSKVSRELLLLEEDIQSEFDRLNISWVRWIGAAKTTDASVQALVGLEEDIQNFRRWLAKRYRTQFEDRFRGADHAAA